MRELWTANLVGKMHLFDITGAELAEKLGVTRAYVSMILSGKRTTRKAQIQFERAVDELVREKEREEAI